MGILEILFAVLILSLPIGEIGRFQLGSIAFSVNDIILTIIIFVWLLQKVFSKNFKRPSYKILKQVSIFIFLGFLSLVLNIKLLNQSYFFVSLLYLIRFVLYFILYLIVFDFSKKFKSKIIYFFTFSSVFIMIAGLVQFVLYPNLRNLYYLGWDEHLYRLFSTFLDPNFAGIILVLTFTLIFGFSINFFKQNNKNKSLIFALISFVNLYEIYLTYSRSALIMLIASVVVFLLFQGKRKISLAVFIILVGTIFILPNSFKTEGTNFFRTASSISRLSSIENAITIFKDSPVFGIGFNSYRYAQHRYGFLTGGIWETTHSGAGVDNSFVFVLVTTGIIGFVSFLFLIFSMFKIALERRKNVYSIVLISSLSGLLVSALFINSFFYVFVMEWIWILLGIIESN